MLLSFLKNITKDFLEKGLNGEKHEGKGGPGGRGGRKTERCIFYLEEGGSQIRNVA